jgi:hypothetical protein
MQLEKLGQNNGSYDPHGENGYVTDPFAQNGYSQAHQRTGTAYAGQIKEEGEERYTPTHPQRTSSGTFINSIRSPKSYQRLAEADREQSLEGGRASMGGNGWDDERHAQDRAAVPSQMPTGSASFSPSAYGASYAYQPSAYPQQEENLPHPFASPQSADSPNSNYSPNRDQGDTLSPNHVSQGYTSPNPSPAPVFPSPRPTGGGSVSRVPPSPISAEEWNQAMADEAARNGGAGTTGWPEARPTSYVEGQGVRGNPRLY